jgi:flagellar basal body-associated protein FliL
MFKKHRKVLGLSLLGLVLLAIPVIGVVAVKVHYSNHKKPAEASARQYAKEMEYKAVGVSCTNKDKDGNGYVSCSLRLPDRTKEKLQCVGAVPFWYLTSNEGCKDVEKLETSSR